MKKPAAMLSMALLSENLNDFRNEKAPSDEGAGKNL